MKPMGIENSADPIVLLSILAYDLGSFNSAILFF